jgi:predicted DNA-binding transcriptional regulator AlpA
MVNDDIRAGSLPQEGFVREKQLVNQKGRPGIVPVSHATLWRMVKARTFPEPIKLSAGVTAWRVEDVRAWLADPLKHAAA